MSTHTELRSLVDRYGDRVLRQPDDLRATLDDFFSEGDTTTGEINLLVDAVRLAAHDHLVSMLDNGVAPRTAIDAAGARLAEARGGNHRSSSWAVAVIGHALGRVSEADVLAYHSQPGPTAVPAPQHPAPPEPATQPPGPPVELDQTIYRGRPGGASVPPSGPVQHQQAPGPYGPYGQGWEQPGPPRRSRTGAWVAAAVVLVVALIAGGVVLFAAGFSGDGRSEASDDLGGSTDAEEPFDPAISLDEVATAYSSLGATLTDGASACERVEPEDGQAELITCTYEQLDVVLSSYEDLDALEARRNSIAEDADAVDYLFESNLMDAAGQFYALRDLDVDDSWMYWDSTVGLTSGYVKASAAELPHKAAFTWFDQRHVSDAARPFDAAVAPFTSEQMWDVAKDYLGDEVRRGNLRDCGPSKVYDGDVEAISCTLGDYYLYFYTKVDERALLDERARARDGSVDDTETWSWFVDGDEFDYPSTGALAKKRLDEGAVQVYWDDTALLVTAYVISAGPGNLRDATSFWCQC